MSSSGTWLLLGVIAAVAVVVGLVAAFENRLIVLERGKSTSPRMLRPEEIRVGQFPELVRALSEGKGEPRWAAVTFSTPDRPPSEDAVNLNLSVEDGKVGFDWVLLSARNIEDQKRFMDFARSRGVEPVARSMNGVTYLRVETGDVAQFTADIVTGMYQRPSTEILGLVYEGFAWPQGEAR